MLAQRPSVNVASQGQGTCTEGLYLNLKAFGEEAEV